MESKSKKTCQKHKVKLEYINQLFIIIPQFLNNIQKANYFQQLQGKKYNASLFRKHFVFLNSYNFLKL